MTKEELLKRLAELERSKNTEYAHTEADKALIEYISDPEISAAYNAITKWYS